MYLKSEAWLGFRRLSHNRDYLVVRKWNWGHQDWNMKNNVWAKEIPSYVAFICKWVNKE